MAYLHKGQLKLFKELIKQYKKLGRIFPLNKKERLYLAYKMHGKNNGKTIGEICKDLKTTPYTLLSKTSPNVQKYIDSYKSDK